MSDEADLLKLLEDKLPEELTPEECVALATGARTWPAVAAELRRQVAFDEHVAQTLGRPDLAVDAILAKARGRGGGGKRGRGVAFLFALAAILLVAILLAVRTASRAGRDVAARGPAGAGDETAAGADAGDAAPADAVTTPDAVPSTETPDAVKPGDPADAGDAAAGSPPPTPADVPRASTPDQVAGAEPAAAPAAEPVQPQPPAVPAPAAPPPAAPAPAEPPAPTEPPPAPPPEPPGPWVETLRAAADLPPAAVLFPAVATAAPAPSADELKAWFAPVPDQAGGIGVENVGNQSCGKLDGLHRLRPRLAEGTALRIALHDWNTVRIHAWAGDRGVTIDGFFPPGAWAGYATTRVTGQPLPAGYVLAAADAGRFLRTNPAGPVVLDLRHADGLLTLSRGDVRILDVPLPAAPTEILFEGKAVFAACSLVPAAPLLPPSVRLPDPASRLAVAADGEDSPWTTALEQDLATFAERADGRLALEVRDTNQPASAIRPLPRPAPQAVVIQIDSFDPGTGIVLGNAAGKPQRVLQFVAGAKDSSLRVLGMEKYGDGSLTTPAVPHDEPLPGVAGRTWVRLIDCGGILRAGISPDGVHWTETVHAGGVGAVGLYAAAGAGPRSIVASRIEIHPFTALAALATVPPPPEPLAGTLALPAWREAALAAKPARVAESDWLLACGLQQLGGDCGPELAVELLEMFWRESLLRDQPVARQLELIDEIATLAPVWKSAVQAAPVAAWYEELGHRLADAGEDGAWTFMAPRLQSSPLLCRPALPCGMPWLARRELMERFVAGRTGGLAATAARERFFGPPAPAPLVAWAEAVAAGRPAASWQRPIAARATKEGATVAAEFSAAIAEEDIRSVGRALVSVVGDPLGERVRDVIDPDLVVSLALFIETALADHPAVGDLLAGELAAPAALRLRQAVDTGDATVLAAVATQYAASAAAAEAHLLLGDRDLAAGRFGLARDHYRAARRGLPPALVPRLAVAEALAAALVGDAADPVTGDGLIAIGARTAAAGDWMQAVAAAGKARRERFLLPTATSDTQIDTLPVAREYAATPKARLEGDVGNNPAAVPPEYAGSGPPSGGQPIDWVARQAAVVAAGPRLLVSNRFQLASYDLTTGGLQWRAGLGGEAGNTHDFPGQPMRPAVTATQAFVRRLDKAWPMLAAVRLADGVVEWKTAARPDGWFVASDPAILGDDLAACTAARSSEGWQLALAWFDPATGRMLREQPLVTVSDLWATQGHDCEVIPWRDGLVIAAAGGMMRVDAIGRPLWIRDQPWVPPAVDPLWRLQAQATPLVADGRAYVVQPAVPAVVAVELDSGRAVWKRGGAGIRRVIGITAVPDGRRLVAEQSGGLVALDVAEGTIAWQVRLPGLLDGCVAAAEGGVVAAVAEPVPGQTVLRPTLVWLDAGTGAERRRASLAGLDDPAPRLGPLVPVGKRFWTLFGRGPADPARDLVELVPQ